MPEVIHITFSATWKGGYYYYSHFTDEETAAQKE